MEWRRTDYKRAFLDQFRRHGCLWDVQSSDYRRHDLREKAVLEMVSELRTAVDEEDKVLVTSAAIKKKIHNIRTTYRRELAKVQACERSGAGVDDLYTPTVFWFKEADSFLPPSAVPNQSSSNLEVEYDNSAINDNPSRLERKLANLVTHEVQPTGSMRRLKGEA